MEFDAILAAVYQDVNYASSPASDVVTRIKRYVNEGMQAILAEPALYGLIEAGTPHAFASVADQARYVLPEGYAHLRNLTDTTNDRTLSSMTLSQYRRITPDPAANPGTPSHWVPTGRVAVAAQPSNASEIFIKSTSASDTNTAYIDGLITGGYRRTASVSMTGATAVTFSASITTFIEIIDVYLGTAAVGTVTVHEGSGAGTELARITIGQYRPRYQGFILWPTPSAVNTYVADVRREHDLLVESKDEPPLPLDFHPMLVKYATFREWELKDDSRAALARQQFDLWLSRLKYRLHSTGDTAPVARVGGRGTGISRLGPYYPAGSGVA